MDMLPQREGRPCPPAPVPEAAGRENGLFWVWVLVLLFWIWFLGRGRGICADYSCLVCFVLLLFNIVSMPGRGSEKLLLHPQINCHIPKLRSSPCGGGVSVSFLLAVTGL